MSVKKKDVGILTVLCRVVYRMWGSKTNQIHFRFQFVTRNSISKKLLSTFHKSEDLRISIKSNFLERDINSSYAFFGR